MKIEKLRKNHKKEIIIGTILTVVIGGALTFRLTHSKYRTTQVINLATGTINYTVPDFKIMAIKISEDGTNYSDISSVPTSGYTLNTENSICKASDTIDSSITIEYNDGKINFLGITLKGTKCYLYFDKQKLGADQILANITYKTTAPDFSKIADTDEGIFEADDPMYGTNAKTYYWRGAVTNNYVKFAGFCWRIIRINGDKTIRLIYDGSTCHTNGTSTVDSIAVTNQSYNLTYNASYYVGWTQNETQRTNSPIATASNAKAQTETWYKNNLNSYDSFIANGKYCNDRDVNGVPSGWPSSGYVTTWSATGTQFYYAGAKRLYENYKPTFNCNIEDIYILKVGAITADEVEFAGVRNLDNNQYYLYNGQNYWTMTPFKWVSNSAHAFYINLGGRLHTESIFYGCGLRPVINLKSDITFSSGDGTQNSPYTLS